MDANKEFCVEKECNSDDEKMEVEKVESKQPQKKQPQKSKPDMEVLEDKKKEEPK